MARCPGRPPAHRIVVEHRLPGVVVVDLEVHDHDRHGRSFRQLGRPSHVRSGPSRQRTGRGSLGRLMRKLLIAIGVVIGLAGVFFALAVRPYRIPSSAMEPTLDCAKPAPGCLGSSEDRVLACRTCLDFGSPSRGDILVFNTPEEAALKCGEGGTFVKRLIGLPGDTVREDTHGFIWIRSPGAKKFVKLKESYLSASSRLADSAHFQETWHVPEGDYFMVGDNRSQSCDSRTWGSVPRNKLIGTVFFVYWPLSRLGLP